MPMSYWITTPHVIVAASAERILLNRHIHQSDGFVVEVKLNDQLSGLSLSTDEKPKIQRIVLLSTGNSAPSRLTG